MGWMQKLYETYELCSGAPQFEKKPLAPIGHTAQQAHIEITLDGNGNFRRASLVPKEETLVPATEKSAGRTSGEAPHPLCDKIQYCAADYPCFGGKKNSYFNAYQQQLSQWCSSVFLHPKAKAVLAYISQKTLVADLVREKILLIDDQQKLLMNPPTDSPDVNIFKLLTPKKEGAVTVRDQGDAFIRWKIETENDPLAETWTDLSLLQAWVNYYASQQTKQGVCLITGNVSILAEQHPAKIRNGADKAKLISSNDTQGYTFKGRFLDADQAAGVGFDVTQKAHNALRWLVDRQAYRNGDQVIATWAVAGKPLPDPFHNSQQLFGIEEESQTTIQQEETQTYQGDMGQSFALRLNKTIAGYRTQLAPEDIVVMGLDAATPGRMAITYYRELKGSEFLDRIQTWHSQYAWMQNFGKNAHFVGAPAPRDIAEAAYGRRLDDKLRKAAVERLLPCIIDDQPLPVDLLQSTIRRICNRIGLEHWEWEKCLGIACALFRGYSSSQQREYSMALEQDRTTRDYLYGRLLAIADNIEHYALTKAEHNRDTSAAKLMQRFSDRPFSTWRNIELALTPYKSRLRASEKGAGFLFNREKLLDEVLCAFQSEDFTNDSPLTGEFLLGFHCQRQKLWEKTEKPEPATEDETSEI